MEVYIIIIYIGILLRRGLPNAKTERTDKLVEQPHYCPTNKHYFDFPLFRTDISEFLFTHATKMFQSQKKMYHQNPY